MTVSGYNRERGGWESRVTLSVSSDWKVSRYPPVFRRCLDQVPFSKTVLPVGLLRLYRLNVLNPFHRLLWFILSLVGSCVVIDEYNCRQGLGHLRQRYFIFGRLHLWRFDSVLDTNTFPTPIRLVSPSTIFVE